MNNKKYIYIIIIFLLFTAFAIIFPKKQIVLEKTSDSKSFYADCVYDGIELEQKYKSSKDYSGISFSTATYSKVFNSGIINVTIFDSNKKQVLNKKISLKKIDDSSLINVKYKLKKNKDYIIKIKTKNVKKTAAITFGMINNDKEKIKYNDESKSYSLDIKYINYKKSYILLYYSLIIFSLLYINFLTTDGGKNENNK